MSAALAITLLCFVIFVTVLLPLVPVVILGVVIYQSGLVGRAIAVTRRTVRSVYDAFVEDADLRLFYATFPIRARYEKVIGTIRLVVRLYRHREMLLGAHSHFQEILTLVHQVERGEWPEYLDDPFDHVKYEAKEGRALTALLLDGYPEL